MKTKNMRKKALLSSVAMLLVAVVALGGATYAWFTTNNSVKASGVSLSTSEEANLFLNAAGSRATDTGWTEDYDLSETAIGALSPASSVDAKTFFSIDEFTPGASEAAYIAKTITASGVKRDVSIAVMSGKAGMDLVVSGIAQRASTGAEDIVRTNTYFWNALRVAVSADGGTTWKIYSPSGNQTYAIESVTATGENAYAKNATLRSMYDINSEALKDSITGLAFEKPSFATNVTPIVTLGTNTPVDLTIRFWLEGNDENANNRAIAQYLDDIIITFGVVAHSGS